MADDVIELDVWKGILQILSVPVKVRRTNNTWRSPSGTLPVMRHGETRETTVANIFTHLRSNNWGADFNLSTKDSADVIAYLALMEEKLKPALLHVWWVDEQNYVETTRPWYAKASPFPLNYFVPGQIQRDAVFRVTFSKGGEFIEEKDVQSKVYKEAKECMNLLSYKLGEKDYFFGKRPSSLDAVVFGYLAPILKAQMANNVLNSHLHGCDNLCRLCNRILTNFFQLSPEEMAEQKKEEDKKKQQVQEQSDFPNKTRNMILAGIFALTSIVFYAFLSGIIVIENVDDEDEGGIIDEDLAVDEERRGNET